MRAVERFFRQTNLRVPRHGSDTLFSEVEGEKEVIQANILITKVATVAGFVEDEIIDRTRIAKLELIRGR